MKLEEQVRQEVSRMEAADVSRILDLIALLKSARRAREAEPPDPGTNEPPYLRARAVLGRCCGALSDDVTRGREERL